MEREGEEQSSDGSEQPSVTPAIMRVKRRNFVLAISHSVASYVKIER